MDIARTLSRAFPGCQWSLDGNGCAGLVWLDTEHAKPSEADIVAAAANLSTIKTWPSKAEFWAEFTNAEKLAILDSTITGIRLLDKELTMWSGQVMSDDARIEEGLSTLVQVGILTPERKTDILA